MRVVPVGHLHPGNIGGMWLAIDVGNSNVKVAPLEDGQVTRVGRKGTLERPGRDDVELLLEGLLQTHGLTLTAVEGIVLCSVVPAWTDQLAALAGQREIALLIADASSVPIPVTVERPQEVGADRLVNVLAAAQLFGAPAIVVDMGTATTFDLLGPGGDHLGGAIAAGPELSLQALAGHTARLPLVSLARPPSAIGRNTTTALQSGAVLGHIGLVQGLLERIRAELDQSSDRPITTVLTGGLSQAAWAREIRTIDAIEPHLTLKGLAILHAQLTAVVAS